MTVVIQSWLQFTGLALDFVGFCYIYFEVWLSYENTYTKKERDKLERDQFDNPKSRAILQKPMLAFEDAIRWRRKAFMSGATFIIFGFFLQIVATLMGGVFILPEG